MLIIVGSMQGTMVSLASMASFGSLASERSLLIGEERLFVKRELG